LYVVNAHHSRSQGVGDMNPLRGPPCSGLGVDWVCTAGRCRNCTSEMGLENSLQHTWSYPVWCKSCVCEGHNCTCNSVL